MTLILDSLRHYFNDISWHFEEVPARSALRLEYLGTKAAWSCFARAREEHRQFVFYSILPLEASEDSLANVAEYITRINFGMVLGNFEMDYTDGHVRCKTSIELGQEELKPALIEPLIQSNLASVDRYQEGFTSVMIGYLSAQQALADIKD